MKLKRVSLKTAEALKEVGYPQPLKDTRVIIINIVNENNGEKRRFVELGQPFLVEICQAGKVWFCRHWNVKNRHWNAKNRHWNAYPPITC